MLGNLSPARIAAAVGCAAAVFLGGFFSARTLNGSSTGTAAPLSKPPTAIGRAGTLVGAPALDAMTLPALAAARTSSSTHPSTSTVPIITTAPTPSPGPITTYQPPPVTSPDGPSSVTTFNGGHNSGP